MTSRSGLYIARSGSLTDLILIEPLPSYFLRPSLTCPYLSAVFSMHLENKEKYWSVSSRSRSFFPTLTMGTKLLVDKVMEQIELSFFLSRGEVAGNVLVLLLLDTRLKRSLATNY